MFEKFDIYYSRFCDYLKTLECVNNCDRDRFGFTSNEAFMAFVYGEPFKKKYQFRYVEKEDKFKLSSRSITEVGKYSDDTSFNESYFAGYAKKSFSLYDTLDKIGHYVPFNGAAYVICDKCLIEFHCLGATDAYLKMSGIYVYLDNDDYLEEIEKLINDNVVVAPKPPKEKRFVQIASTSMRGIVTTQVEVKPFDCDINLNYNDDLPYDRIQEMLRSNKEHLILLHGEPGTGKTSIIKKLINDNPDLQFIYLDFKLLSSFSDGQVFEFLMQNKNHVFIIEDCEKLFTERDNGNQYINSMLNLTDGIIGEAFGIKFICTFNCPPSKIDKAVLREGRLSIMYEFKKLSLEKTRVFEPDATEPKTLAEIYCKGDNGAKKDKKKIGFN